jgi:hypothetical protein
VRACVRVGGWARCRFAVRSGCCTRATHPTCRAACHPVVRLRLALLLLMNIAANHLHSRLSVFVFFLAASFFLAAFLASSDPAPAAAAAADDDDDDLPLPPPLASAGAQFSASTTSASALDDEEERLPLLLLLLLPLPPPPLLLLPPPATDDDDAEDGDGDASASPPPIEGTALRAWILVQMLAFFTYSPYDSMNSLPACRLKDMGTIYAVHGTRCAHIVAKQTQGGGVCERSR